MPLLYSNAFVTNVDDIKLGKQSSSSNTELGRDQRLLESRSIFMSEAVNDKTAKRIVSDLLILDAENNNTIFLYVNSPGGEVYSGFSVFDTISYIKSEVKIINTGLCASIATIINSAAKPENRLSMPSSRFLIHQPLISGQIFGPASDIEITATQINKTRDKINKILADACKQPIEKIAEDTQRDYWMSAEEALEYGLISKIIKSKDEI